MTIISTATDSLLLTTIKEHLVVDIDDDDTLISMYSEASLQAVENYCHAQFLERTWSADSSELEISTFNNLILYIPVTPTAITLTLIGGATYEFKTREWYFYEGKCRVNLDDVEDIGLGILSVEAKTGEDPITALVNQARLITIGSWYSNRENEIVGSSVNELPSGAIKFIMPSMMETAI